MRARVAGLAPTADAHSTYLDQDAITGKTMNFYLRLQLNLALSASLLNRPDEAAWLAGGAVYMPMIWAEEVRRL